MRKYFYLLVFSIASLAAAAPAYATILNATLSDYTIPYETVGLPQGTTIFITLSEIASVEVSIFRLENESDEPSPANLVALIQKNGLAASPPDHQIWWNGRWLIGGDVGRQNGAFRVLVTQTSGSSQNAFTVSTLLHITSVDIHSVIVTPSLDANQNPALPYLIGYNLAKDSLMTIVVKDSSNNTIRTLLNNTPQFGELIRTNVMTWDGLDDDGFPAPLGIYTIVFDANDPGNSDVAITRTRTATIQSLASLTNSPQKLFETNAIVYPNPVRNSQATFKFLAVRNNSTIHLKIYTLAGDLVREETFPNLVTGNIVTFPWDGTNASGKKVSRGLYYYVVREDDAEGTLQTVKKFAVIP